MSHYSSDLIPFLASFAPRLGGDGATGHSDSGGVRPVMQIDDGRSHMSSMFDGVRETYIADEFIFDSHSHHGDEEDGFATEQNQQSLTTPPPDNGRPGSTQPDTGGVLDDPEPIESASASGGNANGRPDGQVPGAPTVTPPSAAPSGDNSSNGRPMAQEPDTSGDQALLTSYTSGGNANSAFNVVIEFEGTWTSELQASFIEAADYISQIITTDLPDQFSDGQVVDDIVITATLETIDGQGGILGSAGPTSVRNFSLLPITGEMTFDIADAQNQLNNGNWEAIIVHEMMHVLGLGTLWEFMGLTSGTVQNQDIRFTGSNATDVYQTEFESIANADSGSLSGVPVEADFGPGTAGGHWDEALFGDELMTGFIGLGAFMSVMTIASFEDMGYDTVYDDPSDANDLFTVIPPDPFAEFA